MGEKLIFLTYIVMVMAGMPLPASAVGLAIQPARLQLTAEWGNNASGAILVSNTTPQPAMYEVRPPENRLVTVAPASFRLEPGTSQLVSVGFRPRSFRDSRQTLEVIARPLGGSALSVASGIRYPLELVVTIRWLQILLRGGLLVAVIALARHARRRVARIPGV